MSLDPKRYKEAFEKGYALVPFCFVLSDGWDKRDLLEFVLRAVFEEKREQIEIPWGLYSHESLLMEYRRLCGQGPPDK